MRPPRCRSSNCRSYTCAQWRPPRSSSVPPGPIAAPMLRCLLRKLAWTCCHGSAWMVSPLISPGTWQSPLVAAGSLRAAEEAAGSCTDTQLLLIASPPQPRYDCTHLPTLLGIGITCPISLTVCTQNRDSWRCACPFYTIRDQRKKDCCMHASGLP